MEAIQLNSLYYPVLIVKYAFEPLKWILQKGCLLRFEDCFDNGIKTFTESPICRFVPALLSYANNGLKWPQQNTWMEITDRVGV